MISRSLSILTIMLHLSLSGMVLSMPKMPPVLAYGRERDAAPVRPFFANPQRNDAEATSRWNAEMNVEEREEEADSKEGEGKKSGVSVYGEQKRFFRPADDERREKFEELRERNSRDQERRRQQRQLRKSQKERKARANPDHSGQGGNKQTDRNRLVGGGNISYEGKWVF